MVLTHCLLGSGHEAHSEVAPPPYVDDSAMGKLKVPGSNPTTGIAIQVPHSLLLVSL